ncbi:hypothetical protein C2G38_2196696 [Gigaspora rosea]|uniref:Uncharacterized protein n=1 Tax=Gigaspora rosea TaxID=44941 RepID=A0A397UW68_9GLOM|nr:hypothetical protein C2G38_2196696 [Gigaspora rosea]
MENPMCHPRFLGFFPVALSVVESLESTFGFFPVAFSISSPLPLAFVVEWTFGFVSRCILGFLPRHFRRLWGESLEWIFSSLFGVFLAFFPTCILFFDISSALTLFHLSFFMVLLRPLRRFCRSCRSG